MHIIKNSCVQCRKCEGQSNPMESNHCKYNGALFKRWHVEYICVQREQLRIQCIESIGKHTVSLLLHFQMCVTAQIASSVSLLIKSPKTQSPLFII